jgi:hypothetical protein
MDTGRQGVVPSVKPLRRLLLAMAVLAAATMCAIAQPTETLSAEKLVAGMKGWGVSDLGDGRGIQRFDVEIIGLLRRYAPGQDLILARVSGAGLEQSGIIAGMSGSPIYVEGKLIGALAYGWPFARADLRHHANQSMLDIRQARARRPDRARRLPSRMSSQPSAGALLEALTGCSSPLARRRPGTWPRCPCPFPFRGWRVGKPARSIAGRPAG